MLYNELPTAFPWYEKLQQQDRYAENVAPVCDYKLITPRDALLPFEIKKPPAGAMPIVWEIFEINSNTLITTLTGSIAAKIRVYLVEGNEYYIYDGTTLGIALAAGYYYSKLTWADDLAYYSEMFFIPDDGAFNVGADGATQFLKIEWWNTADIRPILYNAKDDNDVPYFRNVAYLDTFVTASEPTIDEDGERDGYDQVIITFQKVTFPYRITTAVPNFLKNALVMLSLHDHKNITTNFGIRSGDPEKVVVTSATDANGAISIVDILFQELIVMKKGCGENMATDCVGFTPAITSVEHVSTNYVIEGSAAEDGNVKLYGLTTIDGTPVLASGTVYTAAELLAGITIDQAAFLGYNYIAIRADYFGCNFGLSNVVAKPV